MRDNNDNLNRLDDNQRGLGAAREARITLSEEELAIGKRERAAGAVELETHVETEHVRESVPVMRDEVTVERRPITGATRTNASFEEEHIRVPLTEEEVVTEKRAVAAEEIVVRKHQVQEERTVEADLRREHVEIHESGEVGRVGDNEMRDRYAPVHEGQELNRDR